MPLFKLLNRPWSKASKTPNAISMLSINAALLLKILTQCLILSPINLTIDFLPVIECFNYAILLILLSPLFLAHNGILWSIIKPSLKATQTANSYKKIKTWTLIIITASRTLLTHLLPKTALPRIIATKTAASKINLQVSAFLDFSAVFWEVQLLDFWLLLRLRD
jgi:hypothetical protein